MAHLVQGLILLLAGGALVEGAPFSHALHLKLKPECGACHTQAASSTKLEDNLFPVAQACAGCHKEVSIGEPRKVHLAKFPHATHVRFGTIAPILEAAIRSKNYLGDHPPTADQLAAKNACAVCHREIEQSTEPSHDHFPHMADCLVCHNKIDAPFSCETCHVRDSSLRPASHTPNYLDIHARKTTVKQGCALCHGRQFTCQGCH